MTRKLKIFLLILLGTLSFICAWICYDYMETLFFHIKHIQDVRPTSITYIHLILALPVALCEIGCIVGFIAVCKSEIVAKSDAVERAKRLKAKQDEFSVKKQELEEKKQELEDLKKELTDIKKGLG